MQNSSINGTNYVDLNNQVTNVFLIVTSSIGIPGNLISTLIFSRLIRRKSKMGLLYTWKSLVDMLFLALSLFFIRGSRMFFGKVIFNWSDGWCKAWSFFRRYVLHVSSWVALLTTFDRFVFVLYENRRFKFMKDKRIVCLIIVLIFIALAAFDYPNLYAYLPKNGNCTGSFSSLLSTDIISALLRTYIPITFMVILNYRIYRKMRDSRRRASFTNTRLSRRERHFTRAVIFTDLVFFITKFPLTISFIVYDAYYYSGVVTGSFYSFAVFVSNIFIDFSYLDQTFSFFIHLSFNKLFRKELFRIVSCVSSKSNQRRVVLDLPAV
jgi:hypothetical protein